MLRSWIQYIYELVMGRFMSNAPITAIYDISADRWMEFDTMKSPDTRRQGHSASVQPTM